jgi:hypothetical protein
MMSNFIVCIVKFLGFGFIVPFVAGVDEKFGQQMSSVGAQRQNVPQTFFRHSAFFFLLRCGISRGQVHGIALHVPGECWRHVADSGPRLPFVDKHGFCFDEPSGLCNLMQHLSYVLGFHETGVTVSQIRETRPEGAVLGVGAGR